MLTSLAPPGLPESVVMVGPSLVPVMVTVTTAVSEPPLPSEIVYVYWIVAVSPCPSELNAVPGL